MADIQVNIEEKLADLWHNRDSDWEGELAATQELWLISLEREYLQGMAGALVIRANCYTMQAQLEQAFNNLEQASVILETLDTNPWTLRLQFVYGTLYRNLGDHDKALEQYLLALKTAESLGDPEEIARAKGNLAVIYVLLGDHEKAVEGFKSVLDSEQAAADPGRMFIAYLNLATAYYHLQQPGEAVEMAQKALESASTERQKIMAHGNLGSAYLIGGEREKAKEQLKTSYVLSLGIGDPLVQTVCGVDLADYHIAAGEYEEAEELLLSTLELARSSNNKKGQYDSHQRLHKVCREQEKWVEALEHHEALYQVDKAMFNERSDERIQNLEVLHRVEELNKSSNRQEQEYQRLSQMKDTLLRDVTHDLKNPLSVINTTIYLMRQLQIDNEESEFKINEYCNILMGQSSRMLRLINDVLDMAFLEVNLEGEFHPVSMTELADEMFEYYKPQADAKDVDLILNQQQGISLMGNETNLRAMLSNLVSNAVKYTKEGGQVTVSIKPDNADSFIITVKDTGVGIPEESMPKLFDQFYRVPSHIQMAEGSGLGLSIVKRVVDSHKGTIEISSEVDKGTEFRIRLPKGVK